MLNAQAVLVQAHQAYQACRYDEAVSALTRLQATGVRHPQVAHLLALAHKGRGDQPAARSAFEMALRLAPGDPEVHNNYANFLGGVGEAEAALARYDAALALRPDFADARLNKAQLLNELGRYADALAALELLPGPAAARAAAQVARGQALRGLDRLDEAEAAFGAALATDPERGSALHGRARVALERGQAAATFYRQALARAPEQLDLVGGLAEALEAEGRPEEAIATLRDALGRRPDWLEGMELLARMRSEAGEGAGAFDHYDEARRRGAAPAELVVSHLKLLAKAERHREALNVLDASRGSIGDEAARAMEAVFASEAGQITRAEVAFAGLPATPDVELGRARHELRTGRPVSAAARLQALVQQAPGEVVAWAHLGLAWRLTRDPRHAWLAEQPGFVRPLDLDLDETELAAAADRLRTVHRTRAHPIGQSLRGGTQTRGRLFARSEPEIARLREAIWRGVQSYVDGLPPADANHPLLRHRDQPLRFTGSWSVRLNSSGFHVNHIHPQGVMSSAFYVSLPATLGGSTGTDGWLELGAPPAELGLELPALSAIEPRPGRLALFPSYLFHGTRPFADGERLTVAFDVSP